MGWTSWSGREELRIVSVWNAQKLHLACAGNHLHHHILGSPIVSHDHWHEARSFPGTRVISWYRGAFLMWRGYELRNKYLISYGLLSNSTVNSSSQSYSHHHILALWLPWPSLMFWWRRWRCICASNPSFWAVWALQGLDRIVLKRFCTWALYNNCVGHPMQNPCKAHATPTLYPLCTVPTRARRLGCWA